MASGTISGGTSAGVSTVFNNAWEGRRWSKGLGASFTTGAINGFVSTGGASYFIGGEGGGYRLEQNKELKSGSRGRGVKITKTYDNRTDHEM